MCCYVTASDPELKKTTSVLRRNQYFDSEADLCRVYSEEALLRLERRLLRNQISYFVREESEHFLRRMISPHKACVIVRVNERDMERGMELAEDLRGVEVIGVLPEEDWNPVRAKERRKTEREEQERFRRSRYDAEDEEETYGSGMRRYETG